MWIRVKGTLEGDWCKERRVQHSASVGDGAQGSRVGRWPQEWEGGGLKAQPPRRPSSPLPWICFPIMKLRRRLQLCRIGGSARRRPRRLCQQLGGGFAKQKAALPDLGAKDPAHGEGGLANGRRLCRHLEAALLRRPSWSYAFVREMVEALCRWRWLVLLGGDSNLTWSAKLLDLYPDLSLDLSHHFHVFCLLGYPFNLRSYTVFCCPPPPQHWQVCAVVINS